MYTGTLKRLSRELGKHAHDLVDLNEDALYTAADALPRRPARRHTSAVQLIRKLLRLRASKPAAGKPA